MIEQDAGGMPTATRTLFMCDVCEKSCRSTYLVEAMGHLLNICGACVLKHDNGNTERVTQAFDTVIAKLSKEDLEKLRDRLNETHNGMGCMLKEAGFLNEGDGEWLKKFMKCIPE